MSFKGTEIASVSWSTSMTWRWLKVPRPTSWPERRTPYPSIKRDPMAQASAVAQSMPWLGLSSLLRRDWTWCLWRRGWIEIFGGVVTLFCPISRNCVSGTPVSKKEMFSRGLIMDAHFDCKRVSFYNLRINAIGEWYHGRFIRLCQGKMRIQLVKIAWFKRFRLLTGQQILLLKRSNKHKLLNTFNCCSYSVGTVEWLLMILYMSGWVKEGSSSSLWPHRR